MFTLKLDDSSLLKKSISIISEFITDASFSINKEGIKLVAMDPANICMVVMNMLPSAFTEYKADKDEITLNLDYLQQALKRAKGTDTLALSLESNRLKLTLTGKSTKQFLIPLLEKEEKERNVPELEFCANIDMDAVEFKDYVDDSSIVGDAMTFAADAKKISFDAGDTGSRVHIDLAKDSSAIVKLDVSESSKSIYSVEYLKKMAAASGLANTVTVSFSSDYPLKLAFKSVDKMEMDFILAPRIENK